MTRLTECHNGVAVIKGKRYKEAAEKLARLEDVQDIYYHIIKLQGYAVALLKTDYKYVGDGILEIVEWWVEHEKLKSKIEGGGCVEQVRLQE